MKDRPVLELGKKELSLPFLNLDVQLKWPCIFNVLTYYRECCYEKLFSLCNFVKRENTMLNLIVTENVKNKLFSNIKIRSARRFISKTLLLRSTAEAKKRLQEYFFVVLSKLENPPLSFFSLIIINSNRISYNSQHKRVGARGSQSDCLALD